MLSRYNAEVCYVRMEANKRLSSSLLPSSSSIGEQEGGNNHFFFFENIFFFRPLEAAAGRAGEKEGKKWGWEKTEKENEMLSSLSCLGYSLLGWEWARNTRRWKKVRNPPPRLMLPFPASEALRRDSFEKRRVPSPPHPSLKQRTTGTYVQYGDARR